MRRAITWKHHDPDTQPSDCRWLGWDTDERFPGWVREGDYPKIPARGRLNNAVRQLYAAKAGMGIVQLPCLMADPEPDLRRLARSKPKLSPKAIWLLTHRDLRKTTRGRTFLDFMAEAIEKHRPRLLGKQPQL
jgi:DNA-binding transcriptional LysR family regulator